MKITNRLGLPEPIVKAVIQDSYSKGDGVHISVTQLLKPVRIVALENKHEEELVEDASDRIWALVGQVIHGILERADTSGISERRLTIKVEDWVISGQMDRYIDGVLQDYKFVTSYKFKTNEIPEEYEQQLNCYAEILRQNNHPVKKLELIGILRDWSKMEASRDENYPQAQVVVKEVPLWSQEKAQKFIKEKVILHKKATMFLPECDEKDRWAKQTLYAVMKKGASKSLRNYGTLTEAEVHAATNPLLYVEERPGINTRCEFYCSVSKFCDQFNRMKKERRR